MIRQSQPTGPLFFAFSDSSAAWQVRGRAGYSLERVEHPQHSDQEPLRPLASDRASVGLARCRSRSSQPRLGR